LAPVTGGSAIYRLARWVARPFGYLAFALALLALSGAAWLLGEKDELGFFCERLSGAVWRYPEVTRRGVQMAWVAWAIMFALAVSPIDPLSTRWDEVVLGALALGVAWRRIGAARQVGH
jgi:hypothetical protein